MGNRVSRRKRGDRDENRKKGEKGTMEREEQTVTESPPETH